MTESPRKASESRFPFGSTLVCYFAVAVGEQPVQLHYVADKKMAVLRAHKGELVIYAVWPGQRRSDLFVMDDLPALAAAWKAPLVEELSAKQLEYSRKMLAEGSTFADLAETWSVPLSTIAEMFSVSRPVIYRVLEAKID